MFGKYTYKDLFSNEKSNLPQAKPSGNTNFLGAINLQISLTIMYKMYNVM